MGLIVEKKRDMETKQKWLRLLRDNSVVFYGVGDTFAYKLSQLADLGIKPAALAESGSERVGMRLYGYRVMNEERLRDNDAYIYITSGMYYGEIREYLIGNGIEEWRICPVLFENDFEWGASYDAHILKNRQAYCELSRMLEDELSLEVLQNRIDFFFDRKRENFLKVRSHIMYFERDLISFSNEGVFLDVGAFDGDTIKGFNDFTNGGYGKIFAFEPEPQNINKLKGIAAYYKDLKIIPCGCGSNEGETAFSQGARDTGMSTAGDLRQQGVRMLPVIPIDNVVAGEKVEFIKMDIEGSEMDALKGAEGCIRECKPALAISVYHRPEDIYAIPIWIKSIRSDYKFYLRHYSDATAETVCFAV